MKKIILIPSYEPDGNLLKLLDKIPRKEFDIVLVNDGSGKEFNPIFKKCKVDKYISYDVNQGKGHALKEGFKYIKETYKKDYVVVTMDSDGQHTIEDATRLCEYAISHPDELVLGKRLIKENTPLRSRFGNELTRFIFKTLSGVYVYDTQTGLRAFTDKLIDFKINTEGERFEYEMNILMECVKKNIKMTELEIETIYIEKNSHSHFHAIKDSYRVYKVILKNKKTK